MKYRRRAALAAAILLLVLYTSSIIFALIDSPLAQSLLMASLFCTIVLPAMFYGFSILTRHAGEKNSDERDGKE